MPVQPAELAAAVRAVCVLRGGETGSIQGVINFTQTIGSNQLKIAGEIQGLPADRKCAFHIHEYGDLTNGCASTGNYFNPEKKGQAIPQMNPAANALRTNQEGQVKIDLIDERFSLFGPQSIIGRSVVIDEKEREDGGRAAENDENKSTNPTGTHRLACGVIGICQ